MSVSFLLSIHFEIWLLITCVPQMFESEALLSPPFT